MNGGRILYLVHDSLSPSGSVKNIYEHVMHLEEAGFPAFVVHSSDGFRPPWFKRNAPIIYTGTGLKLSAHDAVVIPEDFTAALVAAGNIPARKIVFCQNHFHIFSGLPPTQTWRSLNIEGVIASSLRIRSFVEWALGYENVPVIPCAIRPDIFRPEKKRLQIALMPRKRSLEAKFIHDTFLQVFREHGDIPWVSLDGATEEEVASTLGSSAVFLSMNRLEGFGLPSLEAMACGCIVVGFHGWGGLEYARADNGFWCEEEDLLGCVHRLAEACTLFKSGSEMLAQMRRCAVETAAGYSPQRQRDTLLDFWRNRVMSDSGVSEPPPAAEKARGGWKGFMAGECLYLGLSSGKNFGWGVCGDNLTKALSRRITTVSIGERQDLSSNEQIPGRVFHTIKDIDFNSLFPARGTFNAGYTFFENNLSNSALQNARRYDVIAVGSTWCKERLAEKGIRDTEVLIQGVDRQLFFPIEEHRNGGPFVIFSGGKFELRKGQDLVLKAFKILQQEYADIVLVNAWYNCWPESMKLMEISPHIKFTMQGESWQEIMERIYSANDIDSGRIMTYPLVDYEQLRSIYHETDLGVFPSRCEGGTNLVLMEYMACAKPVIASYTSGHKDILTRDNSIMLTSLTGCRIQDVNRRVVADWEEPSLDELVATIEYAYHNRDRMSELGRQAGEDMKRYTWESAASKVLEIVYG